MKEGEKNKGEREKKVRVKARGKIKKGKRRENNVKKE